MKISRYSLYLLFLLIPLESHSQNLDTTVDYIENRLAVIGVSTNDGTSTYRGLSKSTDNCEFEITSTFKRENERWVTREKFRFENLDSEAIDVKPIGKHYIMEVKTNSLKDLIQWDSERPWGDSNGFKNVTKVTSHDLESLERLKRAFQQAITLCKDNDPFAE